MEDVTGIELGLGLRIRIGKVTRFRVRHRICIGFRLRDTVYG